MIIFLQKFLLLNVFGEKFGRFKQCSEQKGGQINKIIKLLGDK